MRDILPGSLLTSEKCDVTMLFVCKKNKAYFVLATSATRKYKIEELWMPEINVLYLLDNHGCVLIA